jgi:lipopolysaccharide transport system ATP-binding protein
MGNLAISVNKLGKEYRIGGIREPYRTLRDTLTDSVRAPIKRARALLRGQSYGAAGLDETIWALKDVSFEVQHGEVVGIIGPNGAGKSTLLKILSRITEPTEGYADLYGRVGSLLEVGTGFHPELTGRENIYLNGAILGMSRREIDRKFDEIVDFAGVETFINTPVKHFSSGMYLRLAFAVAAHLEPEILLVDEVLAVGDIAFQRKCMGKMGEVAREGRTVLFVSHNMGAIVELCQKAILLQNGYVTFAGNVEDTVAKYIESTNERDLITNSSHQALELISLSIEGSEKGTVSFDQPFSVETYCRVYHEVSYVRMNCVLLDTKGQKVFQRQTDNTILGLNSLKPGGYRFNIRFPVVWLAAGTYTVVVKFRIIGSDGYDAKIDSPFLPLIVSGNTARQGVLLCPIEKWEWLYEKHPNGR